MKKILSAALTLILLGCCISIKAAPVWNMPAIRIQPNGDTLRCFVTGDEFYQRLHDADGYTIVMDPSTGYFVYAQMENGQLTPSSHIAGSVNPATLGITPGLTISIPELMERRKAFDIPAQYQSELPKNSRNITLLNNIMIFIRFADDSAYNNSFQSVDRLLNDSSEYAVSMYNYFQKASYNHLKIITHFYPQPQNDQILSYQDIYPRRYYMPQSASNPDGYPYGGQAEREFGLIERATAYINENFPVDTNLLLDCDNDGSIDNICYVVKGSYTGWADLLWPHKWNLYDRYVYINGKRVNTFNFMLAGAGSHYFGPSTFCHEMTHTLTAPDLYHYYNWTDVHPAGQWDLMEQNTTPPQHQTAWIKYKYCGWIDSIPWVTNEGTYAMASIDKPTNNCWRIPSPDPNQFYMVEYRNNTNNFFDRGLPGTGMIVYRIDTRYEGNAGFDKMSQFDELYILRPDGNDSVNGNVESAYFSPQSGRTSINSATNPAPMLTGNIPDTTWAISNVRIQGDSLYFDYYKMTGCRMPINLNASNITGSNATLTWDGYNDQYQIELERTDGSESRTILQDSNYINIWGLEKNIEYRFRVRGFCDATDTSDADTSLTTGWTYFQAGPCYDAHQVTIGSGTNTDAFLPICTNYKYSYTQQLYTANDMSHESMSINTISFYYSTSSMMQAKNSCDIYLGYVDRHTFNSQTDMVPIDSLTLVYSGPITCAKGWSSIKLDNEFIYDGEQSLLVAIDDNSGLAASGSKFRVTNGSAQTAIIFASNTNNPDPEALDMFVGTKQRKTSRSHIRFEGCNANGEDSEVSIDDVEAESFEVITSHLEVKVSAAAPHTYTLYDITGRKLGSRSGSECHFSVPQAGVYVIATEGMEPRKVVVM